MDEMLQQDHVSESFGRDRAMDAPGPGVGAGIVHGFLGRHDTGKSTSIGLRVGTVPVGRAGLA